MNSSESVACTHCSFEELSKSRNCESQRGCALFDAVRKADLEGIVAKWKQAPYRPLPRPTWLKVKNPDYSQARDRHELFDRQRP